MKVFERVDPEKPGVEVGEVLVDDDGTISVESDSSDLLDLIDGLVVTADMDGTPVEKDDPDYAAAVSDSIGRTSGWRYYC